MRMITVRLTLAPKEASGLLNVVVLLAALFDEDVGARLIDEPESSLHPQLQSFVLREMEQIAGNPNGDSNGSKVQRAHQEAERIASEPSKDVESRYADVLRALRHESETVRIDESSAIAKLLVPVVARIMYDLEPESTPLDLAEVAREVLKEKASLFRFSLVPESKEEQTTLRVELNTRILEVECFPIDFPKGCDILSTIREKCSTL